MEILPPKGSIEAKDQFAVAPPGHSLTEDNSKWAWGKPPRDVDPDIVINKAIESLKQPSIKEEMMKLLIVGASVEVLVEGYIMQGFQEGRFNPDVGLLIKGPLSLYIANMAEEAGIPYRLFENSDALEEGKMNDETFFRMMQDNNPEMFNFVRETINAGIRKGYSNQPPEEDNFISMNEETE
tara:strand:+ start:62 stop:607 length:546 start_codon:yes stop_codon:yes gene_type:complete